MTCKILRCCMLKPVCTNFTQKTRNKSFAVVLFTLLTLSFILILQLQITIIGAESQPKPPKNTPEIAPMRDSLDGIRDFLDFMSNFLEKNNVEDYFDESFEGLNNNGLDFFGDAKTFYETKQIIKDNAETLIRIGHFLRTGSKTLDDTEEDSLDNASQRRKEIINIKEWEPFYVDHGNNGAINNDPSFMKDLEFLKTQIEEWNPFYINFPDEPSQDAILMHFRLSQSVLTELEDAIRIYEKTRGRVPRKAQEKLDVYDGDQNVQWKLFHQHITEDSLYDPSDPVFKQVLNDMKFMPFMKNSEPKGGTTQKLIFYLQNNMRLVFKPMRFPREQEALPDHLFWKDYERHNAEIAGFHLDMVLGFHHIPPVVGRYINVTSEVEDLHQGHDLTFFWSPAGNKCFYGNCEYYCDTAHAVCGRPQLMEGSFMLYLPSTKEAERTSWRHPWKRSYDKHEPKAEWQRDYHYCDDVKKMHGYRSGRRLLDIMDMAVFDFLQGNMDRHTYETFDDFGNRSAPILYDNGQGFGKSKHDEISILAPIYQCCMIRYSTLKKLLAYHGGENKLSDRMRESLSTDELNPILLEPHLHALDRRLGMVLRTVHKCVISHGFSNVVKDDGF